MDEEEAYHDLKLEEMIKEVREDVTHMVEGEHSLSFLALMVWV